MELLAILVRPFVALFLLTTAWLIARWIRPYIPEGKIKRFLYKPRGARY
jgi:hypothetical protein